MAYDIYLDWKDWTMLLEMQSNVVSSYIADI